MRLCLTTVVEVTGPIAVTVTNREFSTVTIHVKGYMCKTRKYKCRVYYPLFFYSLQLL